MTNIECKRFNCVQNARTNQCHATNIEIDDNGECRRYVAGTVCNHLLGLIKTTVGVSMTTEYMTVYENQNCSEPTLAFRHCPLCGDAL